MSTPEPVTLRSPTGDAPGFRFARYFMAMSLAIVVGATALLVGVLSTWARRDLVDRSQRYAELLLQKLEYELHNEFVLPLREAGRTIDLEGDPEQRAQLDRAVERAVLGLDIHSLKLWTVDGRVVYSSEREELGGTADEEGPKIASAAAGVTEYHLELEGDDADENLVEVFVPIHELDRAADGAELLPTGRVIGVLEVYLQVDDLVAQIGRSRLLIAVTIVGMMLVVELLLWITARRGERLLAEKARQRRELEERLHEAEEVARLSAFTAGIAHEIRTPLGVILSLAETLRGSDPDPERRAALLAGLHEEADRMRVLVGRFLDFARPVAAGTLAPCDLAREIQALRPQLGDLAERRDVRLALDVEERLPRVACEPTLLAGVLTNLVSNSVEVSAPGGRVEVSARPDPDGGGVRIEVADDGPGVPPEQRERIFRPFESMREGGVGLGLAIVAKLVEALGGSVGVADEPGLDGRGARFVVRIPPYSR